MNGQVTGVQPSLIASSLPLVPHTQCIAFANEKYQIAKYPFKAQGSFKGNIKLHCGTAAGYGYLHIQKRHKKEWSTVVTWDNRTDSSRWDNLMMGVVKGNLARPTKVYSLKGGKMCFEGSATSWRKNSRGSVVAQKTWTTAVVVSKTHKRVITAYPGPC